MIMTKDEIDFEEVLFSSELNVYCTFAAITKDWPDEITYNDSVYVFGTQTYIPKRYAGIYVGCAEYKLKGE